MSSSPHRRELEIVSASALAPSVRGLRLRALDGPLSYRAGQWVKLYLPPDGLDRDYSISSAYDAERPAELEIAVTRVAEGPGSRVLHELPVGARLTASGPHGFFLREPEHRSLPALFVGTGTGLAPLRAMLQDELASAPEGPPLILLFGCRFEEDILWRAEIEEMAARSSRLRYEVTLSRAPESWRGRRGYVQAHLAELARPILPAHLYICGLSRMVTEARAVAKRELGLERQLIHSERYDPG